MSRAAAKRGGQADALAVAFAESLAVETLDDAAHAFIAAAAEDYDPGEAPELSLEEMAANLAAFWRSAEKRRGKAPVVRLSPALGAAAGGLERLEVVQDDAPFLVDSLMGEIAAQGLTVRAMFHPVVTVMRDGAGSRGESGRPRRESMIQVIVERVGPDREPALLTGVKETLADVRAAVDDFEPMLALMGRTLAELELKAPPAEMRGEEVAFLGWLQAEHFVFLGARVYDFPRTADGDYAAEEPVYDRESGLGVLRDPDRTVLRRSSEPAVLSAEAKRRRIDAAAVTVAKSNTRSRVHRRGYMDYVAVKRYGPDGTAKGEVRFVGLFTSEAYDEAVHEVPLIRAKAAEILRRAGKAPQGHSGKQLKNIVENHPRDELFQADVEDLTRIALAILHVHDRPRVSLIERRDAFDRFASVLLYMPRDRYDSEAVTKGGEILARAYGGRVSAFYPSFSDAPLARVHYIIGFDPRSHPKPDLKAVEAEIAAVVRTWEDRFAAAVREQDQPTARTLDMLARWAAAFPAGYRDRYDAQEALLDVDVAQTLAPGEPVRVRAFRQADDRPDQLRFKLYRPGGPAPLSDVLPILESMGLRAYAEAGFPLTPAGGEPVWVHEFELHDSHGEGLVFAEVKPAFEAAFVAVWTGRTENDGFNRLVLELSIDWREAALVRALAKYRQQTGLDPTQPVQEAALSNYPEVARLILDLFRTRFDPAIRADIATRQQQSEEVMAEIATALQGVPSLDDDRVLRRLALLVMAIKRTNFYQLGQDGEPAPYISFKVASGELADLPAPKPYREIFVWAVNVEAVHLRFGPVARGGIRWSDRRDDFRTEVLGLAKAQQVKNAVIVPVGAKGGFYPKAIPKGAAPDVARGLAVEAYKTFMRGLLDITDNRAPDGSVVRPQGVVIHDGDDPYLVVAADKGTASFSDIANGLAEDYGFWLGDAFASGGSAGYDHKELGITARGAWEAVKRHFRELGKDIQREAFTVIGVGDMSGDVFGNGMLLSEQIRLVAAFDHRHVFLDPDPDPAKSFAERKRMFELPRSSWDDYDKALISEGGGVFARALKSVPLSAQVRALLGVAAETVTPDELISAVLKAKAELLYLGGIGTYVKAKGQSAADVGDKVNDPVRVNAAQLAVQVVGEGANLGVTQAGRIEFATGGGRINTDAIDNSAGVDSSDHEVNIKILTGALERTGVLTRPARDKLLRSMAQEMAAHVLAHNYGQTLALTLMEATAGGGLQPQVKFMTDLAAAGRLDPVVEGLPDAVELAARAQANRGLTRPELAVLLAYGKLELSHALARADGLDEPYFAAALEAYFPKPLHKYDEAMQRHPLRREILATVLANDVVNRCGPTFASRLMAAARCDDTAFIRAYEASKSLLGTDALWAATDALDGEVPASAQTALFLQISAGVRGLTFWLARRAAGDGQGVARLVGRYGPGMRSLAALTPEILSPDGRAFVAGRQAQLLEAGAPEALAAQVAKLQPLTTAADLIDLAEASDWPLERTARLHHVIGDVFGFDRLRSAAGDRISGDPFERTAVRRLIEDLLAQQTAVTAQVMKAAGSPNAGATLADAQAAAKAWADGRGGAVRSARDTLAEIEAGTDGWSFAKLTLGAAALRELA